MTRCSVTAVWDDEAGVYRLRGDVVGLSVEAATLREFVDLVEALAPEWISDGAPPGASVH